MGKDSFRIAIEERKIDNIVDSFAENAVLHSPVSFKPVEGRAAIQSLLTVLLEVFDDFQYTDQLESDEGTRGLIFRARVGDRELEGLDLLRFDDSDLIRDITVMIRPRSAIEAIRQEVGKRLAR
jgi:hypothetical protein